MNIRHPEHVKRWITGLAGFIFVSVFYYFLRHLAVQVFTVVIALASYFEYCRILLHPQNSPSLRTFKICLALIAATICLLPIENSYMWSFAFLMLLTLALYRFWEKNPETITQHRYHLEDLFIASFGLVYIIGFLSFLPAIHLLPGGPIWLLGLFAMIWACDIAAYYGGHAFGKHKLALVISPGKTLEGSVFGILGALLIGIAMRQFWLPDLALQKPLFLSLMIAIVSQLGDLFESMLKRVVGVKDSGFLLPGHGGMLDRFDSLILAAPFYFYLLKFWII